MGVTCSTHGKEENAYKILVGKPKGRDYAEDQCVYGKIISVLILGK
jgi:hypothetical protein